MDAVVARGNRGRAAVDKMFVLNGSRHPRGLDIERASVHVEDGIGHDAPCRYPRR